MDGNLMPSGQEMSLEFPVYFPPHEYHPLVVSSIQLPATHVVTQAKGIKKSKLSTVETGQPRNRWRAHKKETCQCAVCKQVRGELSSTWFKHDKANCKCSVCRQARGEKRPPKKVALGEPKMKTSSISNSVRRPAGKFNVVTCQSNPVLPEQNILISSGLSGISKPTSLPSEELSKEDSNLLKAVHSDQSYLDGTRENWIYGASTMSSDSGLPKQNLIEMVGDSTADKVTDSAFSLEVKHLMSEDSSEELLNLTSCLSRSQLNSDKILFSRKCKSLFALSKSESLFQSPSQALDALSFSNWADSTAASKTAHSSLSDFALDSSGIPSIQIYMDGTRLILSSKASTSESKSRITCQLTQGIIDESRRSKSENSVVLSKDIYSSSQEPLTESSSKKRTVSGNQIETDSSWSGWSGWPLIAESDHARPYLFDMQTSDYTSANKLEDLAPPLVSKIPHTSLQEASTVNLKKRNCRCTSDKNTCGCDGCMGSTFSDLLCGSVITYPQWISSTLKRRRIFSHSVDSIRPLQETLRGVGPPSNKQIELMIFGFVSSEHRMASQSDELITKTSLQSLLLGKHVTNGSHSSPASISDQSSYSSGTCISLTTSSLKHDSSRSQTASCSRSRQMPLAGPHTLGVWAPRSLMFSLDQAGQKRHISMKDLVTALYRNLLRSMEQGRGIWSQNLKLRVWGACRGHSAFEIYDHRRYPHQAQPSRVEMPSQKSTDIRTHRSQSTLLLEEQPFSLLKVAHYDLPRKHNLFARIRNEGFSPDGLFQNVKSFEFIADIRNSSPVCSVHLSLEGSVACHQARRFHEMVFQIYSHDSGNGRPIFAATVPYTQTIPRCLLKHTCTLRTYGSYSFVSARRIESVSSSCPKAADENTECVLYTRDMSTEAVRPLRLERFTSVVQDCGIVQQQLRDKRKHPYLGFDGAAQPLSKQRRFSSSETQLSAVSPAICRWIPKILGNHLASAIVGLSKHGVLQLAVSRSRGELVTTSQGNLRSDDGNILYKEAEKPEDDLSRRFEHRNEANSYSRITISECLAATQCTDLSCQSRAKLLTGDRVRQTAQIQHPKKDGRQRTSSQDLRSVPSSGLSFQELLNSVSQNVAVPLLKTSSSAERVSVPIRSCTDGKCGFPLEAQELQSATGRGISACNYGEESRTRDRSYKELENMSLNGKVLRMENVSEDNHEDRNLIGDISRLPDVSHVNCESPKTKGTEDTARRSRSDEAIVSFLDPATPAPPLNLSCKQNNFAAVGIDCTGTEDLVTTKFSVSEQLDFDEAEVLQTNMLVEQEKTEFEQKLNVVLEKPLDTLELEELEKCVSIRKPQMRLRESRHETRHVPLRKEGFSYLEHYPDFHRKLESIEVPEDRLKLLRGFFFWIQHTCMSGAFMPWEEKVDDDDCVQIIEETCTAIRQSSAESSNQNKDVKGRGRLGGSTKCSRKSRPGSNMHMSLRARKKIVYTGKSMKRKNVAKQPATTEVKTEGNHHTSPNILKEMLATCLVTAKPRTSLSKEKK